MRLMCPACNAEMTLDVLIGSAAAREALLHALALPAPLGKLLLGYLGCFRPAQRQLSWDRVATILGELRSPIDAAQIERNGRVWPAPLAYWQSALEAVLQARDAGKLTLPLKSHGYLLEIIAALSNSAAAKAEATDNARRAGTSSGSASTHASHLPAPQAKPVEAAPMPDAIKQFVRGHRLPPSPPTKE